MIPGIVAGAPAVSPPVLDNAWDGVVKSPRALMSDSDLKLQDSAGSGTYATARSRLALADMGYFSATPNAPAAGETCGFGMADETAAFTSGSTWAGNTNLSGAVWSQAGTGYFNGSSVGSGGSSASSDIQGCRRGRRGWLRRAGGGWIGGGDPALDTSPTFTISGSGKIYLIGSITAGALATLTIHKDAASTTGVVPAGFTAASWEA